MSVTPDMREYLANIARRLINKPGIGEEEDLRCRREQLWLAMTADERDYLNGLVEDVFGPWL